VRHRAKGSSCAATDAPEIELGLIAIVGPTPKLDEPDGGFAASGKGLGVMKLEEGALIAAVASLSNERAASAVARPHGAPDLRRDTP